MLPGALIYGAAGIVSTDSGRSRKRNPPAHRRRVSFAPIGARTSRDLSGPPPSYRDGKVRVTLTPLASLTFLLAFLSSCFLRCFLLSLLSSCHTVISSSSVPRGLGLRLSLGPRFDPIRAIHRAVSATPCARLDQSILSYRRRSQQKRAFQGASIVHSLSSIHMRVSNPNEISTARSRSNTRTN